MPKFWILPTFGAVGIALFSNAAVLAQDGENFVEANILSIFYHEIGHALIDIEGLPVFGQEEDAADVLSIFLIDALYEEDSAQGLARDAAVGFLIEAHARGDDVAWWGVHGPDEQRYFNTVCLFYGADPDRREGLAIDLGLPEERAVTCPSEYDQAADSWGTVLDALTEGAPAQSIQWVGYNGPDATLAEFILKDEVEALNETFALSDTLTVTVESCGEANAFYDLTDRAVIFCSEFEDYLFEIADQL
ncbi:MAG: DUF4344 domain-containing metallopeptidase [Pseudomonadota bacterium]